MISVQSALGSIPFFTKHDSMADDKIREGDPEKRKKKAPPPDDEDEDRPRKKRRPDDDEDEDDDRPRRKRKIAKDDDDDDLGNSPLSAIVPVGGSIWALGSFYLALLSCIIPFPLLGLFAIGLGILALFTHKHKASYGSLTGNMRAILGILIGFVTMIGSSILLVLFFTGKLQ
jgi:hypothetical protein